MTKAEIKNVSIFAVALVMVVAAVFAFHSTASANPSFFQEKMSATATTTPTFMTAGTATTSVVFDSGLNGSNNAAFDAATLLVQFTASSSATSKLAINYEYSQGGYGLNCVTLPDSCDWYASDLYSQATTSASQDISVNQSLNWTFASTSQGMAAVSASNNRGLKAIEVRTPTRYVRAIATVPSGSTNGAVFMHFVGKRQNP